MPFTVDSEDVIELVWGYVDVTDASPALKYRWRFLAWSLKQYELNDGEPF